MNEKSELIELLYAISVVSERLAGKMSMEEKRS